MTISHDFLCYSLEYNQCAISADDFLNTGWHAKTCPTNPCPTLPQSANEERKVRDELVQRFLIRKYEVVLSLSWGQRCCEEFSYGRPDCRRRSTRGRRRPCQRQSRCDPSRWQWTDRDSSWDQGHLTTLGLTMEHEARPHTPIPTVISTDTRLNPLTSTVAIWVQL